MDKLKKEKRQKIMFNILLTIIILLFIISFFLKNYKISFYILKGIIVNALVILLLNIYNLEDKKIFSSNSFILIATLTLNVIYDIIHKKYLANIIKSLIK